MAGYNLRQSWLVATNVVISASWGRVWGRAFWIIWSNVWSSLESDESACLNILGPPLKFALGVSFLELFNRLVGLTRSPIAAVVLFSCTRMGVELLTAPLIPCGCWQHLVTVAMWSMGDLVRFACFAIDTASPGMFWVKSIRFTVGPMLFPIGAAGEMMMVIRAASDHHNPMILYAAAALWPLFFYPMMQQLLKQRRKHFNSKKENKKEIKSV
jgi:hypothetical protein